MSEYIDRKKLREDLNIGCDCLHCDCSNCLGSEFEVACKAINEQPTVDVQPVKHGKWETKYYVWSLRKAEGYRDTLLRGENADFVLDYTGTRDKRELQDKYHVGNAYDRMIRIVKQELKGK